MSGVEQSCYDEGRWSMAWLVTNLPELPWHMMHMQAPYDGIWPCGRLTPPEWVAATMQFITDAAKLAEVRKRGQRTGPAEEEADVAAAGRACGRGASLSGAESSGLDEPREAQVRVDLGRPKGVCRF